MESSSTRSSEQWASWNRWHRNIALFLALLLALLWLLGKGPGSAASCCSGPALVQDTAPAAVAPVESAPEPAPEAASVPEAAVAEPVAVPRANLYFELDRFEVPVDADGSMTAVIGYLVANPSAVAVISGYHDPTGDKTYNEELAKKRAIAVRDSMVDAGIDASRLDLAKPIETTGSGTDAEARRVEITIRP